jgi:hypothetical protein
MYFFTQVALGTRKYALSSLHKMYNAGVVALNSEVVGLAPGGNPTIANYTDMGSLVCFESKNIFFYY